MRSQHIWHPFTFAVHLLLALAVVFQMTMIGLRSLMESYQDTSNPWFSSLIGFHKVGGAVALGLVLLYLVTKLSVGHYRDIFPWGKSSRAAIMLDVKTLLKGKIPVRSKGGLAGLVQGLGVLLVLVMASSGGICWLLFQFAATQPLAGQLFQIHTTLGFLVWWFIGGHSVMAILHRLLSERYQMVLG